MKIPRSKVVKRMRMHEAATNQEICIIKIEHCARDDSFEPCDYMMSNSEAERRHQYFRKHYLCDGCWAGQKSMLQSERLSFSLQGHARTEI